MVRMGKMIQKAEIFRHLILTAIAALVLISSIERSLASHATPANLGNSCEPVFLGSRDGDLIKTFAASQTKSQFVRDNASDYWNFVRLNGHAFFGEMMNHKGLVVGDTHPGNFLISPLAGRLRFFIADIKDAGHAPFILDVARLVTSTQAVFPKDSVKTKETTRILLKAYIKGLTGAAYTRPESLDQIFTTTLGDYNQMQRGYVDKHISGNVLRVKTGAVEPIRLATQNPGEFSVLKRDLESAVLHSFPGAKILDFATRPRERGGSKDLIRYWALIEYKSQKSIIEFKEIGAPATAHFGTQQETVSRYSNIMKTFWRLEDPSYRVVELMGQHFWMRPKKTDIFRVPYKQKSDEEIDFLLDLAECDAHYLGTLHGRQNEAKDYVKKIKENEDEVREGIRQLSKLYLSRLKDSISRLRDAGNYDDEE